MRQLAVRLLPVTLMLFTGPGVWTMVHGILLGGAALLALSAAVFFLYARRPLHPNDVGARESRATTGLLVFAAAALWLTVIVGTYIVFPPYRATPPAGLADLSPYPRALLHARPDTVWLHAFAMETKEHMPWIAVMLATASAFVGVRYRSQMLTDPRLRSMTAAVLAICLLLVAFVSLMGVFVNKVAPVQ